MARTNTGTMHHPAAKLSTRLHGPSKAEGGERSEVPMPFHNTDFSAGTYHVLRSTSNICQTLAPWYDSGERYMLTLSRQMTVEGAVPLAPGLNAKVVCRRSARGKGYRIPYRKYSSPKKLRMFADVRLRTSSLTAPSSRQLVDSSSI